MSAKNCVTLEMPEAMLEKVAAYADQTGKAPNAAIVDLLKAGLNEAAKSEFNPTCNYYLVKVRVDRNALANYGQKLAQGALDTSNLKSTYCLKEDPAVGVNIWEAENRHAFETSFAPHKEFYSEVLEIREVILPRESMRLLMSNTSPLKMG